LICYSEWKFDADEIEAGLQGLVEEELHLGLESPEVYSHDLFSLIDQGLQKYELELLDFATDGDYYNFLLVRRKDTPQIIRLCQHFGIPVEQTVTAES
jgi:hypothetical protein